MVACDNGGGPAETSGYAFVSATLRSIRLRREGELFIIARSLCLRFGAYSSASKSLFYSIGGNYEGLLVSCQGEKLTTKAQRTQRSI